MRTVKTMPTVILALAPVESPETLVIPGTSILYSRLICIEPYRLKDQWISKNERMRERSSGDAKTRFEALQQPRLPWPLGVENDWLEYWCMSVWMNRKKEEVSRHKTFLNV